MNSAPLKTIVYLEDGSIEATAWADKHVATGTARYATPEEIASYERGFARDDARIAALEKRQCRWCDETPAECTLNECPERT